MTHSKTTLSFKLHYQNRRARISDVRVVLQEQHDGGGSMNAPSTRLLVEPTEIISYARVKLGKL